MLAGFSNDGAPQLYLTDPGGTYSSWKVRGSNVSTRVYVFVCLRVFVYVNVCVCMYVCVYVCMYACICVYLPLCVP